jgi:hypothetical protein
MAALTDAAQLRQSQVRQAVSDFATRGKETTGEISARAVDLAGRTRNRCEQVPRAVVGELRRRMNVLDLATKQDVEAQTKLARSRVSFVLKEFLEAQRGHDVALLESLRAELREELASFAAAIDDDLFAIDDLQPPATEPGARSRHADLDDLEDDDDEDDDEIDLVALDEVDLSADGMTVHDSLLDATDG